MIYSSLSRAVAHDAALRRRRRLQPAAGNGTTVFPPTYPGEGRNAPPRHVVEWRRGPHGTEIPAVLIDSVQSQANRLELGLLNAVEQGLRLPLIAVDFAGSGLDGLDRITSLEAPHRMFDAIFRDSEVDGTPFMRSAVGVQLQAASTADPTALLRYGPSALVFGVWNSTGEGGGLGAKFARTLTSEIMGIDASVEAVPQRPGEWRTTGRRTGSRIDPIGILRRVEVYKGDGGWDTDAKRAGAKAKKVRPSEINHGNIAPSVTALGITMDHAEHTLVISLAALRQLRFKDAAMATAARTYLASLALLAVAEQDVVGYALRSRCDLVPEGPAPFEIVHRDGSVETFDLDNDDARALYDEAYDEAARAGVAFISEPILLKPQAKLIEIVRRSRELALAGKDGEETAEGDANVDA